uniref:C-type lectin domain-containing protein n=1 Tax=Biomphalaria glabrata TaxID=6526 RepID=A0A2C9K2Y0_BIOGL
MEKHFLLWITFTVSTMSVLESKLCEDRLTYHAHTHTCIGVIEKLKTYADAELFCKNFSGGHLVHIFDQETATFVRGLLKNSKIHAFIGHKLKNKNYPWGDTSKNLTYFGWGATPSHSHSYVVITRRGWKTWSGQSYFICQKSCDKNRVFLAGNEEFTTQNIDANRTVTLSCRAYDANRIRIKLILKNSTSAGYELNSTVGRRLDFQLKTQCSSSGLYICKFSKEKKVEQLTGNLKVICQPTYCNDTTDVPTFPITKTLDLYVNIELCVWVFPAPTSLKLKSRLIALHESMKPVHDGYRASFRYLNNHTTQGTVKLAIEKWHVYTELYTLQFNNLKRSSLMFRILELPLCPTSISAKKAIDGSVFLMWGPGGAGGYKPTYIIMGKSQAEADYVEMARVGGMGRRVLTHFFESLSPATKYTFYIDVNDTQGFSKCAFMNASVVTNDL